MEPPIQNRYPEGNNAIGDGKNNVPVGGGACCSTRNIIIGSVVALVVAGAVVGGVCGTGHCSSSSSSSSNVQSGQPVGVLEQIRENGKLRCGVGKQFLLQQDINVGFSADLCRAIGAAVFGTGSAVEFTEVYPDNRFVLLENGDVDVLASSVTHNMERDLLEPTTGAGFSFSIPYLYDGLTFAGKPDFVECAENLNAAGNCTGIRICVVGGTTHETTLRKIFPSAGVITGRSLAASFTNFRQSLCQVVAGEQFDIAEPIIRKIGYQGDYSVGKSTFSKEPLSLVTRDGDPQWSDFVNWVLQGLLHAEEIQISQISAISLTQTDLFGQQFQNMFVDSVAAVGNFGEIYKRHLESIVPRGGANLINTGNSGRIYSMPFGSVQKMGSGPIAGGTLEKIRARGHLRCGIAKSAIFAEYDATKEQWSGLDIDYCRALSAALFKGVTDTIVYKEVNSAERFVALANAEVDVLSRITTVNFGRDVLEKDANVGFSFSQPNFYDGLSVGGIPPFGDCADRLDTRSSQCERLRLCVEDATTFVVRVRELFPEENIVLRDSVKALGEGLRDGLCDAIAGGLIDVSTANVRKDGGYSGKYETGSRRFTKDPLAVVTRQDDPQFSAFAYWVVSATFYAEEEKITQSSSSRMPTVNLFGPEYSTMLRDAISAVGSFGQIYSRNAQSIIPRGGLHLLNDNGPMFYPYPGLQ